MNLLSRLLGAGRTVVSPDLSAAVERAVERVEPRLKQAGGYPDRYWKAVAHGLEYAHDLAAQVPGPVVIDREAYASDPLVHALFASPDEVRTALCVSQSMREFRSGNPDAAEVYALICMRRGTKTMLGVEMDGDVIRRDVPQEAVYFTDHTVADPGRTEVEARERIAQGFFDSLAAHVALRVATRKQEKVELELARDELLARLRGAAPERRPELTTKLDPLLHQLGRLAESLDLRRYVEDFEAVMLAPEKHVYLERTAMVLDGMGLLREPETSGSSEVVFSDLIGRDRRRWTVAMMYCNHVQEDATISDRLATAERWLGL